MRTYVRKANRDQGRSTLIIMEEHEDAVTLRLTGENAQSGIELSALQSFVVQFVSALRGFDRVGRAQPAVKGGHPERRAEAVTAFRLVGFRKGSAVLELEPIAPAGAGDDTLFEEHANLPLDNVTAMTMALASGQRLDAAVADALESARRALGGDAGAIEINLPKRLAAAPVRLDRERIAEAREEHPSPDAPSTVSGRLHAIDLEPDRIAVRSPRGIDWTCSYPEALEPQVMALIDQIVVVDGRGEMKTPRTGSMEIETIRRAFDHEQPSLFTSERVALEGLQESQGVSRPQGLDSVGDPAWEDDEAGEKFFDYLLGRA